jgi:AsmA family protein
MDATSSPRPPRLRRRALVVLAAIMVTCAGALAALAWRAEAVVLHVARAHTHRDIRVDGAFVVHLFTRAPRLTAHEVAIGNPPFMAAGELAQIDTLNLSLKWQWQWPYLGIKRLELTGARLHLVREADARANWHQRPEGPGAGPPLMESLAIQDAHVELDDERRHLHFAGTVSAQEVPQAGGPAKLLIEGSGQLNGRAARFQVMGAPLALARRTDPYPFTLEEHSGDARLTGHGSLDHAFDFRALHGTFIAEGPSLGDLYYLAGLNFPQSGPFRLSGELAREGMHFNYSKLSATTGESDMSGTVRVDSSSGRTRLEAELESQQLRLADLGEREGKTPATPAAQLPDTPLRFNGLRRADSTIRYRAHTLEVGKHVLADVAAQVEIERGLLSVQRFTAHTAGGHLEGHAKLDASGEMPQAALELSAVGVQLEALPHKPEGGPPVTGILNARLELTAHGNSVHEMAQSATGHVNAVIPNGQMRASLAELAGLEASGALGLLSHSRKDTALRCAVASFDAHDGVLSSTVLIADTDKTLITGRGSLRLDNEALDFTLHGRPKHPSFALHSDVAINGTLSHPTVRLSGHGAALQAGAAVALGAILTPVAAALAFINPGLAHNADCVGLISQSPAPSAP